MANVRGVILNGAKYESEDTEARTLAEQAINQTETLENSVNNLETEFANLNTFVADVNQTATTAAATATAANALAQQAENRAQAAYELADSLGHQVGLLHDVIIVDENASYTLSETEENQLFPFIKEGKANDKGLLIEIFALARNGTNKSGWFFFNINDTSATKKMGNSAGVLIEYETNKWIVKNTGTIPVSVVLQATIQP